MSTTKPSAWAVEQAQRFVQHRRLAFAFSGGRHGDLLALANDIDAAIERGRQLERGDVLYWLEENASCDVWAFLSRGPVLKKGE